jgi:predicted protein tyrosine phosphatase
MDESQAEKLRTLYGTDKPIISLNIPDQFQYRDPELIELIRKAYKDIA